MRCLATQWRTEFGALCAIIISHRCPYRVVCALGSQSFGSGVDTMWCALPGYFLVDEHSRCLTDRCISPRSSVAGLIWHLGYTEDAVP